VNFVLYPLAAVGAAAAVVVATAVAISREARRLDDDYLVGQLHAIAAQQPPAPSDTYVDLLLHDISATWDYTARDIEAGR
jgi:hypothetical protein